MEFTALPNGDRAVVDLAKLHDYCLNPYHQDGKHKARVFKSALGVGRADAEWLRERIPEAAATRPAVLTAVTPFGILYVLDFVLTTTSGSAVVRSGWIVRRGEDYARLTTCYVKVGAKR
jgi:hypothetical protein